MELIGLISAFQKKVHGVKVGKSLEVFYLHVKDGSINPINFSRFHLDQRPQNFSLPSIMNRHHLLYLKDLYVRSTNL